MISVIVPAYNVENYFEDCVNSILNSTFRDFELIVVDDGSTDKTSEMCDRFASIDERVHVIHQTNAGVAIARNVGLKASKGGFITFVDSDDLIHPQMLEVLWNAITSGDYDMSAALLCKIEPGEGPHYLNSPLSELGDATPKAMSQRDYISLMFTNYKGFYLGPCHKLYKRELIFKSNDEFLDFKPILAEDVEWLTRVILNLNQFVMIPLTLYYYNGRSDSLTNANSEHKLNDVIIGRMGTHYQCLNLIPKDKTQYRAWCLKDIYTKMQSFSLMAHGTTYYGKMRSECKMIYKATIKEYLQTLDSPVEKMKTIVYHHCPWLHRWILGFGEWLVKAKLIRG